MKFSEFNDNELGDWAGNCTRCGGQFPTRTSGLKPGVPVCTSARDCDANLAVAPFPIVADYIFMMQHAERYEANGVRNAAALWRNAAQHVAESINEEGWLNYEQVTGKRRPQ